MSHGSSQTGDLDRLSDIALRSCVNNFCCWLLVGKINYCEYEFHTLLDKQYSFILFLISHLLE